MFFFGFMAISSPDRIDVLYRLSKHSRVVATCCSHISNVSSIRTVITGLSSRVAHQHIWAIPQVMSPIAGARHVHGLFVSQPRVHMIMKPYEGGSEIACAKNAA